MIDGKSIQRALASAGFYSGPIDGVFGPAARAGVDAALASAKVAAAGWAFSRKMIAVNQWVLKAAKLEPGAIDGLMGPSTLWALERWQDALRDVPGDEGESDWPRQSEMEAFYGKPGTAHTLMALPYPMRLAWDKAKTVEKITINKACADSTGRALGAALKHYGYDRLKELGLDLYGGCYNNRKMRGGKALSTHAYAAALDINPDANQLRWGADRAAMAGPQCAAFLDAFEAEGWVSLGRERNYDWMHLQAARL